MQEFMHHSKASELFKLCMRDVAAANPAREQQGPAAHTRAGNYVVQTLTHSPSSIRSPASAPLGKAQRLQSLI
jgi:hypothetical protein